MKKIFAVTVAATLTLIASYSLAASAECETVTDTGALCVFKDGVSAYHTKNGLFITSEVQGSAKVSIFPGVRGANSLTDGVKNTAAILAHSAVYPAAHICNKLGEHWYLPAAREIERAFMDVPRGTALANKKFLSSSFSRDGFGSEAAGALNTNSRYVFPVLENAMLMSNNNEYSVVCARSTAAQ